MRRRSRRRAAARRAYKAFGAAASGQEPKLLGYAFWTTELEPLERGYDGPIKMLVGMDTEGILTGVIVTEHHEPYGYFSVEPPRVRRAVQRQEHSRSVQGRRGRRRGRRARRSRSRARAARDPQQRRGELRALLPDARVAAVAATVAARVRRVGGCAARARSHCRFCSQAYPARSLAAEGAPRLELRRRRRRRRRRSSSRRAGQALELALFAAFATLALVSFFRKSVRLKFVTLVASVLYLGFYKSQLLSIVNVFGTLSETCRLQGQQPRGHSSCVVPFRDLRRGHDGALGPRLLRARLRIRRADAADRRGRAGHAGA